MAAEVDLCMEEDFVAAAGEKFGINDYYTSFFVFVHVLIVVAL